MKLKINLFFFLSFLFFATYSQNSSDDINLPDLATYNKERNNITKTGMIILSSWAISNVAVNGGILLGSDSFSKENKYFMQMNIYWNTVNLVIGGLGLYSAINGDQNLSLANSINEQSSIEKILLLNTGLDVAYIAGGFWLMEKSKRSTENPERWKGYGKSLILQGGFLLSFDLVLYFIHNSHGEQLNNIVEMISLNENGVGFKLKF
ncbi:hypothetical protein OO013_10125 [Mangrovivirga sp. M17]|uniref:Uncharacterized protein n=1 Tax=Mangrovivirga halotolerans TaxID=2993936 RepID=A0ABT3RR27_9BACT|nr:hypothetical protein [Mangrovivirga halotolerans]MCX2744224.1 hypothetical protein [Mangrovivirga halotolerans]